MDHTYHTAERESGPEPARNGPHGWYTLSDCDIGPWYGGTVTDHWTYLRSVMPIVSAVAGTAAIGTALYLAADLRGHRNDLPYMVVLALCALALALGGAVLILAAVDVVS